MSLNPFVETNRRAIKASTERFTQGTAQYEAYYNGTWRDITSDFFDDVSKAGNTFVRAVRWDGGFRSYRYDRGLIIRKKKDSKGAGLAPNIVNPFLNTMVTAVATNLALKGMSLVPGPVGVVARGINILAGTKTFRNVLIGAGVVTTGINILKGESIEQGLGRAVGQIAGGYMGGKLGSLVKLPRVTPVRQTVQAISQPSNKDQIQNLATALSRLPKVQHAQYTITDAKTRSVSYGIVSRPIQETYVDFNTGSKAGVIQAEVGFVNLKLAEQNRSALNSAKQVVKFNQAGDKLIPAERRTSQGFHEGLSELAKKLRKNPGMF